MKKRFTEEQTFFDGSKAKDIHPQTTAMKVRIDTREGRLLYRRRLGIVEPVFGNLHTHHLRRFTLRSRRKVDAQWKLFALVHNVQKLQAASAEIRRLGKAKEPRYGPSHKPKSTAIREIAIMNNEWLTAETHRKKSPAKFVGFGSGVFLQARWASVLGAVQIDGVAFAVRRGATCHRENY